jgi:hypothetical protein
LEHGGGSIEVAVHDISEGGARIAAVRNLALGHQVALTFPGMKAITGTVARCGSESLGVSFSPSRLRLEELRDLVTATTRVA